MDIASRSPDSRRAGARILDTAEGVLLALRGCTLNQAFVEIVRTAKSHNVSTLSLADALVAIAQTRIRHDIDDAALRRRPRHMGRPVRPHPAEQRCVAITATT